MAQHDMAVDNGPGLAVRTDMVAALQALVSMNSGPIEPQVTYAGMLWLDTSITPNGALKMRDLSNGAWIFPTLFGDDRIGEIGYFARSSPPAGWLKANGQNISRTQYAALFAQIGTQFGNGDGQNTFGLPDLRGQFIRGWDDGRGLDTARAFGSSQDDAVENHGHTATTTVAAAGSHNHTGATTENGAHAHSLSGTAAAAGNHAHTASGYNFVVLVGGGGGQGTTGGGFSNVATTSYSGDHAHSVSGTALTAGSHVHGIYTEPAHTHTASTAVAAGGGGTETRPTNLALLGCIRYA